MTDQKPDLEADLEKEVVAIVRDMNDSKWEKTEAQIRELVAKARGRRGLVDVDPVDPSIETTNDFFVGLGPQDKIVLIRLGQAMEKETALRMAAWIVVLCADEPRFRKILHAVMHT